MAVSLNINSNKNVVRSSVEDKQAQAERRFPVWLVVVGIIAVLTAYLITTQPTYREAFSFIRAGLGITIVISLSSYTCALFLGLLAGLGRVSRSRVANHLATLYVEIVRGVPMLVLIFFIALVLVPGIMNGLNSASNQAARFGLESLAHWLAGLDSRSVPMEVRAIIALSITYGAFQAEIFRAGIQSIGKGQMEAARALGMTAWQAMRYVVIPQAVRNILPALGNDFISLIKDSSLVSVLAVRDITQVARLYAGQSFRFSEAYTVLAVMYLSMTVFLSGLVKVLEKRLNNYGLKNN